MATGQSPGEKFIHEPEKRQARDELYCWLPSLNPAGDRVCGGDCVAFDPQGVGKTDRTQCVFLNAVKQGAIALYNLAGAHRPPAPPGTHVPPPGVNQ